MTNVLRKNLGELCRYFRLPNAEYLREEPIFLSPTPISTAEQRAWVRERANALDAVALQYLFPALERVMGALKGIYFLSEVANQAYFLCTGGKQSAKAQFRRRSNVERR